MTDADADAVVDAAEDADPEDAAHEDADESDQPDAGDLPSPDLPDGPDPEEIEAEAGADADAEDGDDSEPSNSSDSSSSETETATDRATDDTMGDLYAKMVVNLTNAMIDQHGKDGAEPVDVEAARQADLDHHFNRLMDSMGMGRDLPPGQAVVLSTAMFAGGNIAAKTDVPAQMAGELGDLEL